MVYTPTNRLTVVTLFMIRFLQSNQLPLPSPAGHSRSVQRTENKFGDVLDFLVKFGYIPKEHIRSSSIRSDDYFKGAIKRMQHFAGLPASGIIDEATYNLTKRPRCGVPDYYPSESRNRKKRYILKGPRWNKLSLTWRIVDPIPSTIGREKLMFEIYYAFLVWSSSSALEFHRSNDPKADILISFEPREHGDNMTFDGPGGVLAHAFYPGGGIGGDVHFSTEEKWVETGAYDPKGVGVFGVAAHEFGHALGLAHTDVEGALMFPYYNKDELYFDYVLPRDDTAGIQHLYGPPPPSHSPRPQPPPRRSTTTPATTTRPIEVIPSTCDTNFDAVFSLRGEIWFFKGRYFWRRRESGELERDEPHPIVNFWTGLPKNLQKIDAVYERSIDQRIVFFIGETYWLINDDLSTYTPGTLSSLGLPPNIKSLDAVTQWSHNKLVYFFAGDKYWRFNEETNRIDPDSTYPRSISFWKGVPANLDAAFTHNGITYFFKGKGFWELDDRDVNVKPDSPKSSVHCWFGSTCRNAPIPNLGGSREQDGSKASKLAQSPFLSLFIMITSLFIFNRNVNIT